MSKKNNADNFVIYDAKGDLGKRWYVEYYVFEGSAKKRMRAYINRGKTADERLSEAKRIIAEIQKGDKQVQAMPKVFIKAALADSAEYLWRDLRGKTRSTYESKLKIFLSYCECNKLTYTNQINSLEVDKFFDYLRIVRENGNTTLNHYRDMFSTLFAFFWEEKENPFNRAKLKKATPTPALYFQDHQRARLKKYISEHDAQLWRFIEFIFYCFTRPGELRQLKVGDVFLESGQILMRKEISKNKKDQYVSIPNTFLETLKEMDFESAAPSDYVFSGNGFFGPKMIATNKMSLHHQNILNHLKFDTTRHKLYSWKHTGAVAVVKAGIHIKQLQMQLRHHSLDQVNEYLRDLGVADLDELKNNYPTI
jgi:integrase